MSGEQVVSSSESDPKGLAWRRALQDVDALKAGTVIDDFAGLEELDDFVYGVAQWLRGVPVSEPSPVKLDSKGRRYYDGWFPQSRLPSEVLLPRGFGGRIVSLGVEVIDTLTEEDCPNRWFAIPLILKSTGLPSIHMTPLCVVRAWPSKETSKGVRSARIRTSYPRLAEKQREVNRLLRSSGQLAVRLARSNRALTGGSQRD